MHYNADMARSRPPSVTPPRRDLLSGLARRVRSLRAATGLTRRELAERAGLSERFLARIESGDGNVSLTRFVALAGALGVPAQELLEGAVRHGAPLVALLGLRGAGKSTVGAALGTRLHVPFVELDGLVEEASGLPLAQLFEIHGERYYRRLEREVLARLLESGSPAIIATGGGIVGHPESWDLLRRRCFTVWLRARPEDHWRRVLQQGDRRPMEGKPDAMAELRGLLAEREPLYAEAELAVDTSSASVTAVLDRIESALAAL